MEFRNKIKIILSSRDIKIVDFRKDFSEFANRKFGTTTISKWVNNTQQPRLDTFILLAQFFKVEIADLIYTLKELEEYYALKESRNTKQDNE